MNTQNPTDLTVEEAQKILKDFSLDTKLVESAAEKALVRQALLMIADLSDYPNLGVCADTAEQALSALASYLVALGYETPLDLALASIAGSVYLKFNTKRGSSYLDSYTGQYRGVLVSCQSSEYEEISGTYGHLPLDLFVAE